MQGSATRGSLMLLSWLSVALKQNVTLLWPKNCIKNLRIAEAMHHRIWGNSAWKLAIDLFLLFAALGRFYLVANGLKLLFVWWRLPTPDLVLKIGKEMVSYIHAMWSVYKNLKHFHRLTIPLVYNHLISFDCRQRQIFWHGTSTDWLIYKKSSTKLCITLQKYSKGVYPYGRIGPTSVG